MLTTAPPAPALPSLDVRKTPDRLQLILENAAEGVWTLNAEGQITFVSPRMAQLLHYEPDALVGQSVLNFVDEAEREALSAKWPHRLEGLKEQFDLKFRRKDGTDLWASVTSVPVFDRAGAFVETLELISDITRRKWVEAELREQKRLFENLVTVARATTERLTLEATLQNALNAAMNLTDAEGGSLILLNHTGAATHCLFARRKEPPIQRPELVGQVLDKGMAGWVVRNRRAQLVNDTLHDDRWITLPSQTYLARSALSLPILSGENLSGVLTLTHPEPSHFALENLILMNSAADQMALALRNAQIFEAQREMAERQATLYEVLRAMERQQDPRSASRVAVEAIATFAGWTNVAIIILDDDQQHWFTYAAAGDISAGISALRLPITHGVIGRAFRLHVTQYIPNVLADPDYVAAHPSVKSELVTPLRRGEKILGMLDLESDELDGFNADDRLLAESLAEAVALALDNARLYRAIVDERSQLQALIEASREGIIMIGVNRRIHIINAPAVNMLQLSGRPDDWREWPVMEAVHALRHIAPSAVKTLLAEIRRIGRGDDLPNEGELVIASRAVHWLNLPVSAGTVLIGRLLVLRDITEMKAIDKLRHDLTHTMVHDLRNPLTAISNGLYLLKLNATGTLSADQNDLLDITLRSTKRMISMVNAILDISRLESGLMPLRREPSSLIKMVAETLALQATLAKEKNLRLETEISPILPEAFADESLIQRVLQNLIGNAIKFTPVEGEIRVRAQGDSTDSTKLVVEVANSGPGIPPELKGRLFEKFVTGSQEERGSGLGLAFCKLAVEAHGGRIWVESEPGQGAAFMFTLPMAGV